MVLLMQGEIIMTEGTLRGLQDQINSLGSRMEKSFDELKEMLNGTNERLRCVELNAANATPSLTSKIDLAWEKLKAQEEKISAHENKINELVKSVNQLVQTNSILKWILGILTALMTAYLIKLLVGG